MRPQGPRGPCLPCQGCPQRPPVTTGTAQADNTVKIWHRPRNSWQRLTRKPSPPRQNGTRLPEACTERCGEGRRTPGRWGTLGDAGGEAAFLPQLREGGGDQRPGRRTAQLGKQGRGNAWSPSRNCYRPGVPRASGRKRGGEERQRWQRTPGTSQSTFNFTPGRQGA